MIWQGASLIDDQRSIAESTPDTVTVFAGASPRAATSDTATVLRITSDNPAKFRAFDVATSEEYLLRKAGFTVSRYAADCAGRRYTLNRSGFDLLSGAITPKREIRDGAGELIAVTRGFPSGELGVDVAEPTLRADGFDEIQLVDLAFMTWALTFVDAPARRTRY